MPIKLLVLTFLLVAIIAFMVFVTTVIFKNKSNISIMLLGLTIIIIGGIFALDGNPGGIEYVLVLLGLTLSIGGFAKKENIN